MNRYARDEEMCALAHDRAELMVTIAKTKVKLREVTAAMAARKEELDGL